MRFILFMALSFTIVVSCKKNKNEEATTAVSIMDARFTVTGTMKDFSDATYTGNYPHEMTLNRTTSTQGTMVPKSLGIPGNMILIGGSQSFYGTFGIVITFDSITNKITAITNHYGQPSSSGRSAILDPSGVNAWNPAKKEIKIKYWLDQPAVFTPHRSSFDETWAYIGPK